MNSKTNLGGNSKKLKAIYRVGKVIDQNVEVAVNSANGWLVLGTGTAEYIREASGYLSVAEQKQLIAKLRNSNNHTLANLLEEQKSQRGWAPSIILRECMEVVMARGAPLPLGSAVVTSSGKMADDGNRPKHIIHAVTMTYREKNGKWVKITATELSVYQATVAALELAEREGFHSLALPIMGTRSGELSVDASLGAIRKALASFLDPKKLSRVVITADNPNSAQFIRKHYQNRG